MTTSLLNPFKKQDTAVMPKAVSKRNGRIENFNIDRITNALFAAFESVGQNNMDNARLCAHKTISILNETRNNAPSVDQINEINIKSLEKLGFSDVARSYAKYSKDRTRIRVLGAQQGKGSTDGFLMVTSITEETAQPWNRQRIIVSLINEADIDLQTAERIAKDVENKIILSKFSFVTTQLIREIAHTEILRRNLQPESEKYRNFSIPRYDLEEILFVKNKENSNIQINNPEAVNFTISGRIGKEYALSAIFSKEIADAHTSGAIHIHDLDLPARVYCSAHSLEYIKKYGLTIDNLQTASGPAKHTETLTGHINTFFAAIQTFYAGALGLGYINIFYAPLIQADLEQMASEKLNTLLDNFNKMKTQASNKDVIAAVNEQTKSLIKQFETNSLFLLSDEEIDGFMLQRGQELIFAASQNAFSRGGQTLFIDFNVHTGVPRYLSDTLAVEPSGKYAVWRKGKKICLKERRLDEKTLAGYPLMELIDPQTDKTVMLEKIVTDPHGGTSVIQQWYLNKGEKPVTYGDYDNLAKRFALNLLKVWQKGDKNSQPFSFPKCDLHINEDTFSDPEQRQILRFASQVASENGSPYFIFDRDEVSLAACCRLRTAITDNYVLKHPESIRFCGFQNVTINLPQTAYRAAREGNKTLDGFIDELDKTLLIAVNAHLQKRDFIKKLQKPGSPQWLPGKPALDGVPYIDIDKATYIIGIIGLNEVVQFFTGKELHEQNNDEFTDFSLKIIARLYTKVKEYEKKLGLKFSIEESPAESATRRMSKIDRFYYPESVSLIKGDLDTDRTYYTNSIHIRPDAPVDLISRIELQSKFHPAIESGAIIHAFIGEEKPNPNALFSLVKHTFEKTQSAQLTISPEFTVCRKCCTTHRGLKTSCPSCNNSDKNSLKSMTRIVGYFSFIDNWNPSKQAELQDRAKGVYFVSNKSAKLYAAPSLRNPKNAITALVFGKSDCLLCKDLTAVYAFKKTAKQFGKNFAVKSCDVQTVEGLTLAMLGDVNLSALPNLIILDEKSKIIYKGETKYIDGNPVKINLKDAQNRMKKYLTNNLAQ
ncbi:anaerobic ribonucleoside-triphosphate reductase [bacterium]|nr:anaerobic ribonucleoside-triphosphate reductase [bacterium]